MRTLLALLVAGGLLCGCAEQSKGDVVAKFKGGVVTKEQITAKLKSLPRDLRSLAMARKNDFVEDMASEQFLYREALRQSLDKNKEVKELTAAAGRKILIAKLIEDEVDRQVQIAPEEPQQYYDSHKDEFMTPLLLRAAHILVKTREEADAIETELATGSDFEELARKKSLDMTSVRGGDLGFFQKGQFVSEFDEAVFRMKKGQISDPVKTQFGYHVIKLTDRAEPTLREYKAVRALIQERLLNEKRSKRLRALLDQLKGNTKVEIDQKALDAMFGAKETPPASGASA